MNNVTETEIDLGELTGVVAILPNYDDYDFVNITLDELSKEFFKANLSKMADPLNQNVVIKSFFDMVKSNLTRSEEFLDLIVGILTPALTTTSIDGLHYFLNRILNFYTSDQSRRAYYHKIFRKFLAMAGAEKDKTSPKFKVVM